MTEEELQEKRREFEKKASAMYYTKMNLKYLDSETLLLLNQRYHFVDSENLEEIKAFVCETPINYEKTPLLKELVARNEDYLAHRLLDSNQKYLYRTPTLPTNGDALCRRAAVELVVLHQLLEDTVDYNFNSPFKGPYVYDPQMMLVKTVIHRQFYEIGSMLWREKI